MIISVGDELLHGETVDTNAAWLGRALGSRGIPVVRRFTVRDVEADIQEAADAAVRLAGLVFVSGGLGPTRDDVTLRAVSRWVSEGRFDVPEGARLLKNPLGTAPGVAFSHGGAVVILLPGVPRELESIFRGEVQELLNDFTGREGDTGIHHRLVHTTGLPEPALAQLIDAKLDALDSVTTDGITLAYLPDIIGVDLRFTIEGGSAGEAGQRFDRLIQELASVLGPWSFQAQTGDLADAVTEALRRAGLTIAVAESCTGGLLAKRLTDRPGASRVFLGGVVAYSNDVKVHQVGVVASDLDRSGAVSEIVARQLAVGIAGRMHADIGVGVTGVAGPGGGSDEKPVGTVWIGVMMDGSVHAELHRFEGDREAVRERAAQGALAQLHRRLVARASRG